MTYSKCPYCGCQEFYIKDPDDEYEVYDFNLQNRKVCFVQGDEISQKLDVNDDTEAFCNKCAWHDKLKKIK